MEIRNSGRQRRRFASTFETLAFPKFNHLLWFKHRRMFYVKFGGRGAASFEYEKIFRNWKRNSLKEKELVAFDLNLFFFYLLFVEKRRTERNWNQQGWLINIAKARTWRFLLSETSMEIRGNFKKGLSATWAFPSKIKLRILLLSHFRFRDEAIKVYLPNAR